MSLFFAWIHAEKYKPQRGPLVSRPAKGTRAFFPLLIGSRQHRRVVSSGISIRYAFSGRPLFSPPLEDQYFIALGTIHASTAPIVVMMTLLKLGMSRNTNHGED